MAPLILWKKSLKQKTSLSLENAHEALFQLNLRSRPLPKMKFQEKKQKLSSKVAVSAYLKGANMPSTPEAIEVFMKSVAEVMIDSKLNLIETKFSFLKRHDLEPCLFYFLTWS